MSREVHSTYEIMAVVEKSATHDNSVYVGVGKDVTRGDRTWYGIHLTCAEALELADALVRQVFEQQQLNPEADRKVSE